ncbi:hypothetical protein CHU98_g10713 [Xylaria longipes]|nr:hypothetical protein CHU98_g10713 [Xylaria longipes]
MTPTTTSNNKMAISAEELGLNENRADIVPPLPKKEPKEWLQILSTFIVFFNTWGFLLTSGAFQSYYELVLIKNYSNSDIAWISTTCAFILLSGGAITGPLYDRGFYPALLLAGSLLQVAGIMLLSLCTQFYQLFLCHGVCIGLGAGILFTPSVSAAAACLPDPATRAKAMGLMSCGSSIGGIVYPLMLRYLVPRIGFPWATRSLGFVVFGLYLLSYLVLVNYQPKARSGRRFFDTTAFVDWPFIILCVAGLFNATAYFIPLLYLPLVEKVRVPSIDPNLTLDLLPILNGASVLGRLLIGLAAARIGPTETITICLALSSVLLFAWIAVDSVSATIVWSVFWGIISGALVALPGAFIPLFCPSTSVLGTRSGLFWISLGLGFLIGSPIAGSIYDLKTAEKDSWHLQVFAAVFMAGAAVLSIYPVIHLRRKSKVPAIG